MTETETDTDVSIMFETYLEIQNDPFFIHNISVKIIKHLSSIIKNVIDDKFYQEQMKILNILIKYCDLTTTDLIGILTYIKRLNVESLPKFFFDHENINYILLTICIVYCKMYHENTYDDSYYCKITQMNICILLVLEITFTVNLPLIISDNDFKKTYINILNTM
jgi:hypothetical protein